jgi:alcohol dehydrogenase, propanol-preferring
MKAMLLTRITAITDGSLPLEAAERPDPEPGPGEIAVRVGACGVCRTELDEVEGRNAPGRLPVIPGHQVVGRVAFTGREVRGFSAGDRVAVGWIHSACGVCPSCLEGRENLCADFKATGRDADGGYAELMRIDEHFAFAVPEGGTDAEIAPLLCAGAVGYRALRLAFPAGESGRGRILALSGFGSSAHVVLQAARRLYPGMAVFAFARNERSRAFARELGADWAGDFGEKPPEAPDAVIDTTPSWGALLASLAVLKPGGTLVVNAIRKEDADRRRLAELDFAAHLWMEKCVRSVANVTRRDIREFLSLAAATGIRPEVTAYPLSEANRALADLKRGGETGSKVLIP